MSASIRIAYWTCIPHFFRRFDGWSSSIVSLTTDFIDYNQDSHRYSVGVSALVRVTLSQSGAYHEDVGYGTLENSKSKGAALDKCKKEAITDGLKRALRNFGNVLGNCLYDKSYTQQVVKLKVPQPVFDVSELYRGPEPGIKQDNGGVDVKPARSIANASTERTSEQSAAPRPLSVTAAASAIPPHLRAARNPSLPDSRHNQATPGPSSHNAAANAANTGLITPAKTPDSRALPPVYPTRPLAPQQQSHNATTRIQPPNPKPQSSRVSFADSATTISSDKDPHETRNPPEAVVDTTDSAGGDEFSFSSDDDAFYAGIDLGEADLGRPIDFEEGLGPSVRGAGDESVLAGRGSVCEEQANLAGGTIGVVARAPSKPLPIGQEQVAAAAAPGAPAHPGPARVPFKGFSLARSSTSATASTSNDRTRIAVSSSSTSGTANAVSNPNRIGNEPENGSMNTNARTNANANTHKGATGSNTNGSLALATKRPAASSMGGFKFPPGVVRIFPLKLCTPLSCLAG